MQRIVIAHGSPSELPGDLQSVVMRSTAIAVVTVVGYEEITSSTDDIPPDLRDADGGGRATQQRLRIPTLTRFDVKVERVIAGDIQMSRQSIASVLQTGGYSDGVAYEVEGDPLLVVGASYLLFFGPIEQPGPPAYWVEPLGRFRIDNGRLEPTPWVGGIGGRSGIGDALGGRTVDEAAAIVGDVLTAAP